MIRTASDVAFQRLRLLLAVAACAGPLLAARSSAAADKTSLACIRAAEDGQAARDGGQLLRARELFAVCAARECPAMLRRDCTAWVEDARRQTPSVVVVARDTAGRDVLDAQVSVDGTLRQPQIDGSAIELDPGPHVVRVQPAGVEPIEERVVLAAGEKNRTINVTFSSPRLAPAPAAPVPVPTAAPPPSNPSAPPAPVAQESTGHGLPAISYLLGGIGVASLGVFGYFGVRGMMDADHLRSTCVPACQPADVADVHTKLVVADVALGVGVVSLAVATWFAVRALSAPGRASVEVRVAPRIGGASGGLVVLF
jgi:hypothetical protein